MFKKILGASTALIVGGALAFAGAALPAAAHDKSADLTCSTASVSLTNYDQGATAKIVLDGVVELDGTFGGRLVTSRDLDPLVEHTLTVDVVSYDGDQYNYSVSLETDGTCAPVIPPITALPTQPTASAGTEVCVEGVSQDANGTIVLPEFEGGYWAETLEASYAPGVYTFTAVANDGYVIEGQTEFSVTVPESADVECYIPPTINECEAISTGPVSTNLDNAGWTFAETRATGHNDYVSGGLHVYTEGATATDKAAGYHALGIPLQDVGEPSISLSDSTGGLPSIQLGVDRDGNGTWDGYLVNEGDIYGAGNWWTSKAGFGVPAGGGYASLGTLDQYLQANPSAQVLNFGYSLGSGVLGSTTINSITVGCVVYTFDFKEPVVVPENPGPTAVVVVTETEPTCDSKTVTVTTTTTYVKSILVDNKWVLDPQPSDKSKTETSTRDLTDAEIKALDCPVVVVPPVDPPVVNPPAAPAPTVPSVVADALAYTGANPFLALSIGGGIVALLIAAGSALLGLSRRASQVTAE